MLEKQGYMHVAEDGIQLNRIGSLRFRNVYKTGEWPKGFIEVTTIPLRKLQQYL